MDPPLPNSSYGLDRIWDGNPVTFNTSIQYKCARGMKVKSDFNLEIQEALCKEENVWVQPTWKECTESE